MVKGNFSSHITYQNNEIAYPGNTGNNQCIDNVSIDYAIYRNNYLHDLSDAGIIPKGGAKYPIAEGNVVFYSSSNAADCGIRFGGNTDLDSMEPGASFQTYYMIARNNLLLNCPLAGVGTYDCYHGYCYNNLMYNCGTGTMIVIQHSSDCSWTPSYQRLLLLQQPHH